MVALRGVCESVGLVRMVQVTKETCLIEATIDGLVTMPHQISVHQYGDMSEGGHRYQGRRQEFEEGRAELLGCEAPETTWRRAPKFFGSQKPHPLINDSLRMCKK